jgi:hypothetical protein
MTAAAMVRARAGGAGGAGGAATSGSGGAATSGSGGAATSGSGAAASLLIMAGVSVGSDDVSARTTCRELSRPAGGCRRSGSEVAGPVRCRPSQDVWYRSAPTVSVDLGTNDAERGFTASFPACRARACRVRMVPSRAGPVLRASCGSGDVQAGGRVGPGTRSGPDRASQSGHQPGPKAVPATGPGTCRAQS